MAQAAAPHMRETGKREAESEGGAHPRCIVNVSSTTGASSGWLICHARGFRLQVPVGPRLWQPSAVTVTSL